MPRRGHDVRHERLVLRPARPEGRPGLHPQSRRRLLRLLRRRSTFRACLTYDLGVSEKRELPEGSRFVSTYMTKEDIEVIEAARVKFGEKRNSTIRRIIQEWARDHLTHS